MKDFDDIRNHCDQLVEWYSMRDNMLEEIRQMFHMEWSDQPTGDWIKETMSPTAFNAAIGAVRLLTSTEPQWSVPFDEADLEAQKASEKLERAARAMWNASGRIGLRPVHYDVVMSAILFGEVVGTVTKTADLVEYAKAAKTVGGVARMERIARETPYIFTIHNPMTSYPDYDRFGLRGLLTRKETTWGEVLDAWGDAAETAIGTGAETWDRLKRVNINDWYDWECRCVWLDETNDPIYSDEHGLSFLPVVAQITEGSTMFDLPEQQRFPLLYSVWKSGLWKRENLSLTVIYSLIFGIGSNPLLQQETDDLESPVVIDRSIPGGVLKVPKGERLSALMEKVIDPAQWQGLDKAQRLNEESTISKQALGAPPQNQMAFSAISLLTQSGRLPLMGAKQIGGQAIANLMIAAFDWWREDGDKATLYNSGLKTELAKEDIPERVVIECNLEPDLPTDKMNMANIAQSLIGSGTTSKRWARENILSIGQSDQMDKEIWMEKRIALEVESRMMMLQQQMKQQAQMAQQPQGQNVNAPVTPYPEGGIDEGQPMSAPMMPEMMSDANNS